MPDDDTTPKDGDTKPEADTKPKEKPPKPVEEQIDRHEVHSLLDDIKKDLNDKHGNHEGRLAALELKLKDPAPKKKEGDDGKQKEDDSAGKPEVHSEEVPEKSKHGLRIWHNPFDRD